MSLTGKTSSEVSGLQAHHIFPQTFIDEFSEYDKNVHDPHFGTRVDSTHQDWSYEYQERWRDFLDKDPSRKEIFDFVRELAEEYDFETHFNAR